MKRQVIMHVEGVPNPNAMKFVLENGILSDRPYEFTSYGMAKDSPLASKLLLLRYVNRVLLNHNYVTVVKEEKGSPLWDDILYELRMLIQQHLENDEAILYVGAPELTHPRNDDVIVQLVRDLLDRHIRPAAQEDGGDILFESYQQGVLELSMHGACHKCPYVKDTLGKGVEPLITARIPEVKEVRPVYV